MRPGGASRRTMATVLLSFVPAFAVTLAARVVVRLVLTSPLPSVMPLVGVSCPSVVRNVTGTPGSDAAAGAGDRRGQLDGPAREGHR